MDRFIGIAMSIVLLQLKDLKSNMDRFIDLYCQNKFCCTQNLKSNMDRFIAPKKLK